MLKWLGRENLSTVLWTARTGVNKSYEKGCKDIWYWKDKKCEFSVRQIALFGPTSYRVWVWIIKFTVKFFRYIKGMLFIYLPTEKYWHSICGHTKYHMSYKASWLTNTLTFRYNTYLDIIHLNLSCNSNTVYQQTQQTYVLMTMKTLTCHLYWRHCDR
jgi:hypothetical protein